MSKSLSRALLRSSSLIILISSSVVLSSPASFASEPLDVVVTADRSEVPLKNTGSAITVITSEEIEKYGSKNIADVLRTVPGLTIAESGGLGSAAKISLRGATASGSMVLLDGIRIGDPSNTEGYFDFGNFSTANIERIEIVRGPQSALYGSDAMGGVINIITKKGKRTPVREVTVEGGSYGTISTRGSMSGATDEVSYSFGVNALHSNGFPRYGYRANPNDAIPLYPFLDPNAVSQPVPKNGPTDKSGISGNLTYRINPDFTIETGLSYFSNRITFANPQAFNPDNVFSSDNHSTAEILNGFVRASFLSFDGALKNKITVFGNETNRDSWLTESWYCSFGALCREEYVGKRYGAEYQGDVKTGKFGELTYGVRRETESVITDQVPLDSYFPFDAIQNTNSAFAAQRFKVTDNFDVSVGGRVDSIEGGKSFETWRSTFAYRIDETATKLRGSIGAGAHAPTLYQRYSDVGTPDLKAEESFGTEVGIDQAIADGKVNLSATVFDINYTNKIAYSPTSDLCAPGQSYCYYNLKSARSTGAELGTDIEVQPSTWRAKFAYTFLNAIDLSANRQMLRVPRHQASLSLVYVAIPKWEFEPRITYVGDRYDVSDLGPIVTLPGYVRFDLDNRYKINDSNDAYIRFENLTDAHTEDVYHYGSAGRSVYVGWTTRW